MTAYLRQMVRGAMARLVKWTTVAGSGGKYGYVRGTTPPVDASLGEESTTDRVRWMVAFGVRSQPTSGTEMIVVSPRGGSVNAVCVASENLAYGPTDLAEGEVAIFSKASGCVIKLDKDGKITVTASAGKDVVVNDGTKKVARDGEKVAPTATMKTLLTAIIAAVNAAAPGTISPAQAAELSLQIGNVDGGADHFKG